jgi:predicted nuclease with TOPRIM domain
MAADDLSRSFVEATNARLRDEWNFMFAEYERIRAEVSKLRGEKTDLTERLENSALEVSTLRLALEDLRNPALRVPATRAEVESRFSVGIRPAKPGEPAPVPVETRIPIPVRRTR